MPRAAILRQPRTSYRSVPLPLPPLRRARVVSLVVPWCPLLSRALAGAHVLTQAACLAPHVLSISLSLRLVCVWYGRGGRACRAHTTHTHSM